MQVSISGRVYQEDDEIHIEHEVGRIFDPERWIEAKEVSLERETRIFSEGGEKRVAGEGDQEINQPYEIKKSFCTLKMTDL